MHYAYKAIGMHGEIVSGKIDASNTDDLEAHLQQLGLELITANALRQARLFAKRHIARRELINFCFYLEQLTQAGIPLLEGLHDLRDSLEDIHFRAVITRLIEGIQGGKTLSQAMSGEAGTFSLIMVNLVGAGESSGQLTEVLRRLGASAKWEDELAAHSKKLLIYPGIVCTVILATSIFLMLYLVPQLKVFIENMGQTLPWTTRSLFFISDLLRNHWLTLLLLPPTLIPALWFGLRHNESSRLRLDSYKLRLPVIGTIFKMICLSRFASTFSMLYAAGIPILDAIKTTQGVVGNRQIAQALDRIEHSIREGCPITTAFAASKAFPPIVIRMLRIGETTGELDKSLQTVSYFYNRDIEDSVGKVQAMIEPILTVVSGLILGWIMFAVIGPIYDLISKMKM